MFALAAVVLGASPPPLFEDTFEVNSAANAPINTQLERQRGALAPLRWELTTGVWNTAPIAPGATMTLADGRLWCAGWPGMGARLAAPLSSDARGGYHVRVRVDPAAGATTGLGWVSVMFATRDDLAGWVTAPENLFGVLVRSSGAAEAFAGGRSLGARADGDPRGERALAIDLESTRGGAQLTVHVDGARVVRAPLLGSAQLPGSLFVYFGCHHHPGEPTRSWFDDLRFEMATAR